MVELRWVSGVSSALIQFGVAVKPGANLQAVGSKQGWSEQRWTVPRESPLNMVRPREHRIVLLKGTFKYQVPLPGHFRATQRLKPGTEGSIQTSPEHWWARGINSLSKSPVPLSDHYRSKQSFLNTYTEPLLSQLCAYPSCSVTGYLHSGSRNKFTKELHSPPQPPIPSAIPS